MSNGDKPTGNNADLYTGKLEGNTGSDSGSNSAENSSAPTSGTAALDPAKLGTGGSGAGDNSAGEPKRKRGRPANSGTPAGGNKTKKEKEFTVSALDQGLRTTHLILANILRSPELILSEEESKTLSEASIAVLSHYDTGVSQKAVDIGNLLAIVSFVYGTRILAIRHRRMMQGQEAPIDPDNNVVPLRQ